MFYCHTWRCFSLVKTQCTEFLHHRTFPPESFPLPLCRWGRMGHLPLLVISSPERDFPETWSDEKQSVKSLCHLTASGLLPGHGLTAWVFPERVNFNPVGEWPVEILPQVFQTSCFPLGCPSEHGIAGASSAIWPLNLSWRVLMSAPIASDSRFWSTL